MMFKDARELENVNREDLLTKHDGRKGDQEYKLKKMYMFKHEEVYLSKY